MKKASISKITILIILVICAWTGKNIDSWGKNKIIQNDVISYYAYLPAAIIFTDLNFNFMKDLPEDFDGKIWLQTAPTGKPILRMTMGMALLWMPFFLMAHAASHIIGVSALGYSWPYSFSIFVAVLFYLGLGLYYLRKILLRYFSDVVTAVTLLLVVLATNLMYYVISEPGMTHVYNFALITIFLNISLIWIEKTNLKNTLLLGLLAGIIVLIRPVNILVLLFPALIGINSLSDFWQRIRVDWKWIIIAGFTAFLVWVPQLVYWKLQTQHFLFNSYMDQGKFYFLKPQIIDGLFSYRKGWLLYTPLMIFALMGTFWLKRFTSNLFLAILSFILINIYVIYSWWCWWYGGSYGSRPMIDMYGILAIPLAAFLKKIWTSKYWIKGVTIIILVGLIWLNFFQMSQYRLSLLHWDSMTKEAYWGIFGKKTYPEGYDKMIKIPDYDKALKGEEEY